MMCDVLYHCALLCVLCCVTVLNGTCDAVSLLYSVLDVVSLCCTVCVMLYHCAVPCVYDVVSQCCMVCVMLYHCACMVC